MSALIERLRELIWSVEDRLTLRQQLGLVAVLCTTVLAGTLVTGAALITRQGSHFLSMPLRDVVLTIALLGAGIGGAGVSAGMLIVGRFVRPIRATIEQADLIGRIPDTNMFPRQRGSHEAVQLTRALRSLLRRLGFDEERRREAELQYKDDVTRLRKLADIDHLTNLLNRRALLAAAGDAVNQYKRYRRGTAALMIDIDHFKKINDTYGHAAGDDVIRRVAQLIGDRVRASDKAARFGGEEFIVLAREIDDAGALLLAERIRTTVENGTVVYGTSIIKVTVSIGVALVGDSDRDIEDLIERADQGLYSAKKAGRNRVIMMPLRRTSPVRVA